MFLGDVVEQSGYFETCLFFTVYIFLTGKIQLKNCRRQGLKLPIGFRLNYFLGDNIILRSYYRYYADSWGTRANTANLEIAYKVSAVFLNLAILQVLYANRRKIF